MNTIREFATKVKWISVALFLGGVLTVVISVITPVIHESEILHDIFKEIGVALLIASIVGLIIETTEVIEFFEERLVGIVSKEEFLKTMVEERLFNLLRATIVTIGNKKANNPRYYHDRLPGIVADEILSDIGEPSFLNYTETIDYCYSCDADIEALGVEIKKLSTKCVRLKIKTRYTLVVPFFGVENKHEITSLWEVKKIPGLDKNKHFMINMEIAGEKQDINLDDFITETDSKVELKLKYPYNLKEDVYVDIEVTLFEFGASGYFWNYTENYIENINVHFSSDEALDISGEIYGIAGHFNPSSITSHSISMSNPGLLMPGHGYFIVWQEIDASFACRSCEIKAGAGHEVAGHAAQSA